MKAGVAIDEWQNSELDDDECSCVSHQMAMKWLRKEHNILLFLLPAQENGKLVYLVEVWTWNEEEGIYESTYAPMPRKEPVQERIQRVKRAYKPRKVAMYDLNGKYIKTYNSVLQASKDTEDSYIQIDRQLKTGKITKNIKHIWKQI